ncbi:MAG: hypothetical protein ABSD75_05800 [Terriglobales bacterium]|jgi:hypothetical protein
MGQLWRGFVLTAVAVCVSGTLANGQDSPSLGDLARQARQQKQDKAALSKPGQTATPPKVITNEEISGHSEPATAPSAAKDQGPADPPQSSAGAKVSAEEWKSQIQRQKEVVSALQANIDKLNGSIQFAPGNCVSGCVQWNEHQQQKQQEVEQMRSQLETQKKDLQQMQNSARQQGYGSSVYDP